LDNRCTFKKNERISIKREIDRLFDQGSAFISYPLRVIYLQQKPFSGATVSVLTSVSKKKIKQSVKRNRMKRLIKEAYRLNKVALIRHCTEKENGLLIAFLFIGSKLCRWEEMETAMQRALGILIEKME
jgi:ribonuclease P protein component